MVKMGKAIDDDSPPRTCTSCARSARSCATCSSSSPASTRAEVVKPFVKTLKGLQDQLGRFQDREVQANALRELAPEVKHPATLMAMGVLVDRFIKEEAAARAEFADRFDRVRRARAARDRQGALRVSRVLATYNIKGGVGKTSAAVNLATLAAREGAPHAAVGPRPAGREHLPVPRQAQGQGRRRASSCAARPTSTAQLKGTDTEGLDLLPADFSYRHMDLALGRTQEADDAPRAACSSRCRTSTSTRSSTARRASRSSPRASSRPPTRCSCRSSRRRCRSRTLEQLHSVLEQQGPAGARLLLDGRPPQEAAPRADGRALATSTTCSRP